MLTVTRNPDYHTIKDIPIPEKEESGSVYTYTVDSDVLVRFNDRAVQRYAIDGKMLIIPEKISDSGMKCEFDAENNILNMTVDGLDF